ncbi:ComF family protein [Cellulosimicrobium cellulans]|uniref:ComF family protein n=1 Tax=Cellulosimicrobium cellulans TaxID=1710 RepID=UPI001883EB31|nr:ComF family protein [Cellulosimicrobium cellulans]MBE9926939.1 ComF family protein [Cellulosimicrobium cellulans]
MLLAALDDVARLVLPVACPGCDAPDVRWCASCLAPLRAPLRRRERGAPRLDRLDGVAPLPVWAPAPYAGPVRGVVVAWKDRGRADLDRPLGDVARRAGTALGPVLGAVLGPARGPVMGPAIGPALGPGLGAVLGKESRGCPVLVVPAPTTRAARRARGRDPVGLLARAVAAGLDASGTPARSAALLVHRGRARDQVGLGSRARGARLGTVAVAPGSLLGTGAGGLVRPLAGRSAGARRGPPGRRPPTGAPAPVVACLLVDDVVTTGATLAACERALTSAGALVLGAVALAATPSPGERRRSAGQPP